MLLYLPTIFAFSLSGEAANILGVFLQTAFSHQVAYRPLWRELSLRGHKVTVLTTDPMNDPTLTNLTEIDLSVAYETWNSTNVVQFAEKLSALETIIKRIEIGVNVVDVEFALPEVQDILTNRSYSFDLVIAEPVCPIAMAFSEIFDCPLIAALSLDTPISLDEFLGNSVHLIMHPSYLLPCDHPLSLVDRIKTVIGYFAGNSLGAYYQAGFAPIIEKYFGTSFPPIMEIMKQRLTLFITYFNPEFGNLRPLSPAFVALGGGTHMQPPKPLPEDLKQFLDNATAGAVYFSLGSNPFGKIMSLERRTVIMEALSELPYKVLWKFEDDSTEEVPGNIKMRKWLPQQDVLRHPNLKVFVTQGGIQSIDEALSTHVPLVVMPKMGDQRFNARRAVNKGMGLRVDFETVTKEDLKAAVFEVVNNPKYKNRMKELDEFARDQPMKPLEKTVWWIEYVLRHNGAKHLMSALSRKPFYHHFLQVDVFAALLITMLLTTTLTIKVSQFVTRSLYRQAKTFRKDSR